MPNEWLIIAGAIGRVLLAFVAGLILYVFVLGLFDHFRDEREAWKRRAKRWRP